VVRSRRWSSSARSERAPARRVPGADQLQVPPRGRPELLHGLHLPVGGRPRLGREQPRGVSGVDHLHPAPPAAVVAGHRVGVVPAAHRFRIRPERERLAHEPPRDRVPVPVEGDATARPHHHAPHLVRVVRLVQREEVRPLLGDVQAGDLPGDAVLALVGDRVPPGLRLGVQIGEVSERAPGPEAAAQVFYRVLHAALLVPTPDIAGHRPEAVVPRVGQEAGMEADEAPVPLGDRGREVVVPGLPGTAPHEGPGLLVTAQEGLEGLAEGEHDGEQPRVGEHQHEGVHGAPDPEHVAELAPVDLGHLGDPERERHERLAGGPGAEPPHEGPQRADPPAVALGPQDLQDVHGGALRILAEQRLDARDKRGEARRPRPGGGARERHAPAPDHLAHARPLHGEVPGDLTQGPVLGEDEAQDLGLGSGGQHGGTSFRGARCTTRPPTGLSRLVSGTRAPLSAANSHCHKGFELDRVSRSRPGMCAELRESAGRSAPIASRGVPRPF